MKISELYKFLRRPIQHIIHHSEDYVKLSKDYSSLSQQYTDKVNENTGLSGKVGELSQRVTNLSEQYEKEEERTEKLSLENQGRVNTITALSDELSELEISFSESNEQRISLAEELAKTQEQLRAYQEGVLKSSEYLELVELKQQAEERVSDLEKRIEELEKSKKDLGGLYAHQKQINLRLQREFRNRYEAHVKETEKLIISRARGSDKKLSYVTIRDLDEIMVVTPEFEEKYHFKDEEIRGKRYSDVLENADVLFLKDLKKFFKDPKKRKLQTVIVDGKKKERVIYFVKYPPEVVPGEIPDDEGNLVEHRRYYTRVDVHDFGIIERTKTGFYKIIHHNGEPRTMQEFIERQQLKEVMESEIHKKIESSFPKWSGRGMTAKELEGIEDACKNYEDFRSQVAGALLKKRAKKKESGPKKPGGLFKRKKQEKEENPA